MGSRLRSVVRDFVPPVLPRLVRRALGVGSNEARHVRYAGDYASWGDAVRDSDGYDVPFILDRVRESIARVRDGRAAYERDGVILDRPEYPYPLLACLLRAASGCGNRLRLLDVGGSL